MWRSLLHVIVFMFGLLGTALGICSLDAVPFWSWARNSIGYIGTHLDDYDTVFLGSSRVSYGVIPEYFDARMAELGIATHSYNAGVSGTWPHDYEVIARWLLGKSHGSIRRVVIELYSWDKPCEGNWMSDQEVELHSAGGLVSRLHSVFLGRSDTVESLRRTWYHLAHTAANVFRVGQGARIVDQWACAWGSGQVGRFRNVSDGYVLVEGIKSDYLDMRRRKFLAEMDKNDKLLAQKAKNICPDWILGGFNMDSWRSLHRALLAHGIEPIYVAMPTFTFDFRGREALSLLKQEAVVLEMDLPTENASIFVHELWFDTSHYNRVGGEVFSRYLATKVFESNAKSLGRNGLGLETRWTDNGESTLDLTVRGLSEEGEVSVVVSPRRANQDLGGGIRLEVELPGIAVVVLERKGATEARASLDAGALPADQECFAQACLRRSGRVVAVTRAVVIKPRH